MYHKQGYSEVIERTAEFSMKAAVEEVQALAEYAEKRSGTCTSTTMYIGRVHMQLFLIELSVGHHGCSA